MLLRWVGGLWLGMCGRKLFSGALLVPELDPTLFWCGVSGGGSTVAAGAGILLAVSGGVGLGANVRTVSSSFRIAEMVVPGSLDVRAAPRSNVC
jgi:hypothetical protein